MRNFEQPGRSTVHATSGMVATSHSLASVEALQVLRDGGNAMDAALAACAVQCVVEPGSTGIGGDCFAMIWPAGSERPVAYNGSGRAPAAASLERLAHMGLADIERTSAHAVTIPGSVEAWCRLTADHGRLSMREILAPAIRLAGDGYAVSPRVHWDWSRHQELLRTHAPTRSRFLTDDQPPAVGAIHRQPELARTLERIAEQGPSGFYDGPVAEEMVAVLSELGGFHSLEDFALARGEYVDPISTTFQGYEVHECPPNGQGIIALMLLQMLEPLEAGCGDPLDPQRLHYFIEAARIAYAARDEWVAEPDAMEAGFGQLLAHSYTDRMRQSLDPDSAASVPVQPLSPVAGNTVCIAVVDRDGNAVSLINSLFLNFGSGILTPRHGVLLNNRGQGFSMQAGHPNQLDGGKRPLNTIIPGMVSQKGRPVMPFGVMGGHYQSAGHAYMLSNLLRFGLDLQESMDLPRLFPILGEGMVEIESTFRPEVLEGLRDRGHRLIFPPRPIGGSQAIWIDHAAGTLVGASDHRKDGCALGY
ncbi:gamma-glutamyltransferase family protein [Thioalkalivibrio sp. ALJ7]|uniref:gamma-glutamyltransferase family protein n=1 Tax=Thioalkalivibrio sp. ALJ7 TaxID=1158756 RepID=UPI00037A12EC|nr:gamma-glutamyltransferase family protein [Thioalkalivibrio sp. ALJ7]